MRIRGILGVVGLIALAVVLNACRKASSDTEVVVYSAGPRGLAEWVCAEFEAASGLRTRLFCATTGEVMAKLQAEEFFPQADVVVLASPTAAEALKLQGLLSPLPADLPVRPDWTDPDGTYTGTSACALGIALRADEEAENLEWSDLLDGTFEGRTIMPSPSQSGTSNEFLVAFHLAKDEAFWTGLEDARNRGLQITGPNNQALTSVVLGAHDAVMAAADYLVFRQIERGEPIVMHFPASGSPVIPRPIAILADAPNGRGAEAFVRFYFSPEVQARVAAEHLIPADPAVPLSEQRQLAGEVIAMPFDAAAASAAQRGVLRRFQYEIAKGGSR